MTKKQLTIGSSETTREPTLDSHLFHFDDFLTHHQPDQLRHRPREETIRFLEWFVGFSEGDGCFEYRLAAGRPRFSFTIKQLDPPLLYKIRNGLGFGSVRKIEGELYRFVVEDQIGIRRLLALFNGNLVLPKVRYRYETFWVNKIPETGLWSDFKVSKQIVLPSLETAWMSGFIEAEGCFYAGFSNCGNSMNLKQTFTLTQKDVSGEKEILEEIRDLFQSKTKLSTPKENIFRIEISSLVSQQVMVDYCQKFCLKGKKKITLFRWWRIFLLRSTKAHYDIANKQKVRRLVNSLNASTKKQVALKEQIPQEEGT